jgi:hypothetical protein
VLQLISEPVNAGDGRTHSRKKDGSAALKDAWLSSSAKSQDEFLDFADLRRYPIVIDGDGVEAYRRFRLAYCESLAIRCRSAPDGPVEGSAHDFGSRMDQPAVEQRQRGGTSAAFSDRFARMVSEVVLW